jgi:murein L,D-transpeptidase YafK
MRAHLLPLITLVLASAVVLLAPYIWSATPPTQEKKTVADRLQEYGAQARARTKPFFDRAHMAYPPTRLVFVGLKTERVLQIYAARGTNSPIFIRSYPILAASGGAGPKLREGDRQVPEGMYPIESLNPNSAYHLSLRIGYPNSFDRAQASQEGRTKLGGDIMIHGKAVSIGCLAMGDEAAEDLFVLAADTGLQKIQVILSPVDFRTGATVPKTAKLPDWTETLYRQIKSELAAFPLTKAK